jgi:hypothetical protein
MNVVFGVSPASPASVTDAAPATFVAPDIHIRLSAVIAGCVGASAGLMRGFRGGGDFAASWIGGCGARPRKSLVFRR